MELPDTTIAPTANHTHTVIFLHDRGETALSLRDSLNRASTSSGFSLPQCLPSFLWVFPQAPRQAPARTPHELLPQWFDIWSEQDYQDQEELQINGLRNSVESIREVIKQEVYRLGGRWDKVILAGMNQGGAVAVHTILNLAIGGGVAGHASSSNNKNNNTNGPCTHERLGALMSFSSRLPFSDTTLTSLAELREFLSVDGVPESDRVVRNTPVLLEHCIDHGRVSVEDGRMLRNHLREYGSKVTWKEYPRGGNSFSVPAGLDDVLEFLNRELALSSRSA